MPYVIRSGIPTRVVVRKELPEGVVVLTADEIYLCPHCDKESKTEAGLESHLADKH